MININLERKSLKKYVKIVKHPDMEWCSWKFDVHCRIDNEYIDTAIALCVATNFVHV